MSKPAPAIELSASERQKLENLARRRRTAPGLARRTKIILMAASGIENQVIAERLRASENTVGVWRRHFAAKHLGGLYDEPRPGAPRKIGDDEIAETIRLTLETTSPGATHWSLRSMAGATGYAPSTIHRNRQAVGLQPHRTETFKLYTDPLFVEKVRDIVGLCIVPQEKALVLCVDEKGQIQALDRDRPLLPIRLERHSYDDNRHGTLSLFADINVTPDTMIAECSPHHRDKEFLNFLYEVESNVPENLDVHLVIDNYMTHKTPVIRRWLAKRRRWYVHVTPTSASWIDQVERFFANPTEKQIHRDWFRSTCELEEAICDYIATVNDHPRPFRWVKSADGILASIKRFRYASFKVAANQRQIAKTSESGF